ncbi:hypothetical protein [Nocardioides sp. B-3]|nr:hypothetical protein [Nocardioides sp. B-3]
MTHFQFDVPTERFNEVGQKLGTSVVADVGRRVFDYYYDREIED